MGVTDDMPSAAPGPGDLLGDLLDTQAVQRPDAEALTDGHTRLTWREYLEAAQRLARALAAQGVRSGDRVAVHLPKSVESFVAVHAIVRLGGVVVPVDWFAPAGYVGQVLSDAGAAVVVSPVTGDRGRALLGAGTVRAIVDPSDGADPSTSAPRATVRSDDPAYVIYTSGSTGRPKGIVHTHASALAYARLAAETYGLTADDRMANVAPLHFDQSTFELYAGPLVGAAVVVIPDGVLRFPASSADLIDRERVTVWYSVPYAIAQLTSRGALERRDLSSLRWVLFGGEPFPPAQLASLMRLLPNTRFSNVYGPAEVNQCTYYHLDEPPVAGEAVPIGRPWNGATVVVVDGQGNAVVDGEPGELLVSSPTMMDRYWGMPDLTADSIVVTSEGAESRRWYRTGDLVRRRADGELVFIGRLDHQVKLRGHRIELEAVEAAVVEDPSVDVCAAIVERDGEDRLVVLVHPPLGQSGRAELMAQLRHRLPRYAVPAEIVDVDSLPRTPTGKVDRRAAATELRGLRANQ